MAWPSKVAGNPSSVAGAVVTQDPAVTIISVGIGMHGWQVSVEWALL